MSESKRRKTSAYRIGRNFEYSTKRDMESHGYTVMRSPASKSPIDLMAIKDGRAVFVQCKIHGAITIDEWNKFYAYCMNAGAVPVLAQKNENGRGIKYQVITGEKKAKRVKPYPCIDSSPDDLLKED